MNSLWTCKDSRDHVTRCIWPGRDNQKKQSEGKNTVRKHWGHPVRALHVKKKKEEEGKVSYLYPLLMLIIEHLTMRLRSSCPALNSSSTFLAAELIRAAWSADRPRLHQHLAPAYSQLWTEIWCFHHNFYYLRYTSVSVSYSSLGWESAPPAVCLVNQIQMFTEQKTEFWINFNIILRIF